MITNAQYVAVTRSRKHLTVIHDKRHDYLPFLGRGTLPDYCDMIRKGDPRPDPIDALEIKKPPGYAVTDLTRHVPEAVMSYCFQGFFTLHLESRPALYRV